MRKARREKLNVRVSERKALQEEKPVKNFHNHEAVRCGERERNFLIIHFKLDFRSSATLYWDILSCSVVQFLCFPQILQWNEIWNIYQIAQYKWMCLVRIVVTKIWIVETWKNNFIANFSVFIKEFKTKLPDVNLSNLYSMI
jgi:hypothetical protein